MLLAGTQTFADNSVMITATQNLLYPDISYSNVSLTWYKIPNTIANNGNGNIWQSIAMSSSGQYQSAVIRNISRFGIFGSSDYGVTWINQYSPLIGITWNSISMSSSGQYRTAVADASGIYISSNYGENWVVVSSSSINGITAHSVAMSSSGQYQSVVDNQTSGKIYISSDFGQNWNSTSQAPTTSTKWESISMSSSGQYQTAICSGNSDSSGNIYISSNYGLNWTKSSAPPKKYTTIAVSSSGQYQTAVVNTITTNEAVYTSFDYGITWLKQPRSPPLPSTPNPGVPSIAMSSSGQYQTLAFYNSYIYSSANYGVTWKKLTNNTDTWTSIAMSSSGQYQSAVNNPGFIYACTPLPLSNLTVNNSAYLVTGTGSTGNYVSIGYTNPTLDISANINVGPTGNSLYVRGNVYAQAFYATSDYRIKHNIVNLNNSYNVNKMRPVLYENVQQRKHDIGLIAHELQEQYPFLVYGEKDGENLQSINYNGVVGILVKETQDLKQEIKDLKEEIRMIKEELSKNK